MSSPEPRRARAGQTDPAPVFAALGDATRLELVVRLSDGQARSITRLSSGLNLTRQGVTKHLRVLEEAGLVSSIRIGRESRFAFRREPIEQVRSYLEKVSRQWDDALARLKHFVEADQEPPKRSRRSQSALNSRSRSRTTSA